LKKERGVSAVAHNVSLSVVVPVYNEAENIPLLFNEIKNVCISQCYDYEIILVDDGSTDNTHEITNALYPLTYVRMRRNFGQTAAMDAGIKTAKKDFIITMDGDLQNDPADIPGLVDYLLVHCLDVVSGWRKNRKDTFSKRFASRGANFLRTIIVNDRIHDSGCSLKIYRRECFDGVKLFGEMHRFIPALLKIKGFTVGEMIVNHRPRIAGKTNYNWRRTIKGFVDMVGVWFWHKYSVRPMHLLGGLGIFFLFTGGIFSIWTIVLFVSGQSLNRTFQPMLTITFLLVGILLFVFGLMSDILSKIYYGTNIDTPYSIKKIVITEAVTNEMQPERILLPNESDDK